MSASAIQSNKYRNLLPRHRDNWKTNFFRPAPQPASTIDLLAFFTLESRTRRDANDKISLYYNLVIPAGSSDVSTREKIACSPQIIEIALYVK